MRQSFGSSKWTVEKLLRVRQYIEAYAKAMKNQYHFTTYYIDGFAGTGYVELREMLGSEFAIQDGLDEVEDAARNYLQGSAAQALEVDPPFDRYIFIENSDWRIQQLAELELQYASRWNSVEIIPGDANQHIQRLCTNWNRSSDRGVVFLDPFGMSVEWRTLEAIAATQSLDLWYLIPISATCRLLPRHREVPEAWRPCLMRFFGTDSWQSEFYNRRTQTTLFDTVDVVERVADWQGIQEFILDRLRHIFPAVADNPLVLTTDTGSPLFLLCFAVSNPNATASTLAIRIARHILGHA